MADVFYTSVTWTAGDILTEAKLDNMVANDRAVDAMNNGVEMTDRSDPVTPASTKLFLYVKDKSGVPAVYAINDAGTIYELSESRPTFLGTITGTLVVGTSLTPILPVHRTLTIVEAYAVCKTGPVGAAILIDIKKNGATIWSTQANRLTIADGATSGIQTTFDTTALAKGDSLTIDINQVGSTTQGADMSIYLRCK